MTDQQAAASQMPDPAVFADTMARIAEQSQRMVGDFLSRQAVGSEIPGPDPLNLSSAFMEMTSRLMADPAALVQAQVNLWQDMANLWQATARRMMGEPTEAVIAPPPGDRRFRDPAWEQNQVFDFIKQSYLLTARWMQSTVHNVAGLDDKTRQKLDFYTRQYVDALAPTNFLLTNPEALRATVESGGENLLRGLQNLLDDLEAGKGQLSIKMTDPDAFALGRDIAVTPGKVVFQNDLLQLLQYTPTTDKVQRRPLLIVPPWINKFYILDLRADNSFVRWAVGQGHTVFMVSWVNPDERLAQKGFDDYLGEGLIGALDAVEKATGEPEANVVGYCLGGTLLAAGLAYMAAKGIRRVASATFLTTMVDFGEPGDLGVFIDEEQLTALETRMRDKGYLEGRHMAKTFNMLRANDLIWSFVISNYLLGKTPFPFDLLYWNGDSTRMPAAMHSFYLRRMYQENKLVEPGGITLLGEPLDLRKIEVPTFIVSTRDDHIAPWRSTYAATQLYSGPVKFVLAASGHIAGVVNPPAAGKYGYWTNEAKAATPEAWLAGATEHKGSWWPEWNKWLGRFGGGKVAARKPGAGKLKPIEDAPGSYVQVKAKD
jgi:polyhydroxyalkanoate synthase